MFLGRVATGQATMNQFVKNDRVSLFELIFIKICVCVIVFQKLLEAVLFQSRTSMLDELAIVVLFLFFLVRQLLRYKVKVDMLYLLCISIYFIFVSFFFGRNRSLVQIVMQVFLHMQFFILFISLINIHKKAPKFAFRLLFFILCVSLFGVLLQAALPGPFSAIIDSGERVVSYSNKAFFRGDGFQKNSNALGVLFALSILPVLFSREILSLKMKIFFSITIFIIVVYSGSRSGLLFLAIALFFIPLSKSFVKDNAQKIFLGFFLGALLLLGPGKELLEKSQSNIDVFSADINETKYIRWIMTYYGAQLAIDHFPIGAGAGTFGSTFSHGSVIYDEIGISALATVEEGLGIHDSNYGTILGEFGIIGLIIFFGFGVYLISKEILGIHFPVVKGKHIFRQRFIVIMLLVFFISPFFRPFFSSSYYSIVFILVLLSISEQNKNYQLGFK